MVKDKGRLYRMSATMTISAEEWVGTLLSNGAELSKKIFNGEETHLTVGDFMKYSKVLVFWIGPKLYYTSQDSVEPYKAIRAKEEEMKAKAKAEANDDTEEEVVIPTPVHPTAILKAQEIKQIVLEEDPEKGDYDYPKITLNQRSEDSYPITLLNLISNCSIGKIRVDGKTYSLSKSSTKYPNSTLLYKQIEKINIYLTRDEENNSLITSATLNVTLKKEEEEE
jgi:hypothetical protein